MMVETSRFPAGRAGNNDIWLLESVTGASH